MNDDVAAAQGVGKQRVISLVMVPAFCSLASGGGVPRVRNREGLLEALPMERRRRVVGDHVQTSQSFFFKRKPAVSRPAAT